MAIITIYQGASGSGEELAEAVAQSLGCDCISREVLVEASLRYGIPEAKLNEIVEKGANWWQRFVETLEPYRIALQAAFCEIAATHDQGGLVYHGHLGHELMPGFRHVLKVLLTAPMDVRIEQVKARNHLTDIAARRQGIAREGHGFRIDSKLAIRGNCPGANQANLGSEGRRRGYRLRARY